MSEATIPYRVLARKYRPTRFADLIGQDALVRTLTNAIAGDRLAHAWLLTGVRGVGKTTTARIIARSLNCSEGPTVDPCGVCENCVAIAEDRHVDVLEIDAASHSGVAEIRELTNGVHYLPVVGRYKIYIVDEVHMLSTAAFNALLKTLEEPPGHAKFVFATTEIRKVPVTVLSRCQRFDLRRVDAATLVDHFRRIAASEQVEVSDAALGLVARAADGSVRDGLSLLDQAIAHAESGVDEAVVREMLGLADRVQLFDLFEAVMKGEIPAALDLLADQYRAGADPVVVVQDLLALVHWLTRLKVAPEAADDPGVPEAERVRGRALAERLSPAELTRSWQMLLKGLGEAQAAPAPLAAVEMALIRLAYAADLPTPAELVKALSDSGPQPGPGGGARAVPAGAAGSTMTAVSTRPLPAADEEPGAPQPRSFAEAVELFARHGEHVLYSVLRNNVHPVHFEPGRIEFRQDDRAPANLAGQVAERLNAWTGRRWMTVVSQQDGEPTLEMQHEAAAVERKARAAEQPLVKAILDSFPGAEIIAVRETGGDSLPEPDGDEDA